MNLVSLRHCVFAVAVTLTAQPAPSKIFRPVRILVRLQRDAQDSAAFYIIDLVDFEQVPAALPMPAGFTSITDASLGVNIKPNDGIDHADDLEKVLLSGVSKLYFPPGEYIVRKYNTYKDNAALDNKGTEIAGAGMWYTRIKGRQALFFCDTGGQCNMHDFAIFGDSTGRDEPVTGPQKAVGGPQGNGTQLYNLGIEHEVAGLWIGGDPPYQDQRTQNIHIHDVRIRNHVRRWHQPRQRHLELTGRELPHAKHRG